MHLIPSLKGGGRTETLMSEIIERVSIVDSEDQL
jgi:hypothetical protein